MGVSGNPAKRVVATGIRIEAKYRHHADIPEPIPGQHYWIAIGMWRLVSPTADRFDLDIENLLTIDGPGCWVCEQPYSVAMVAQPCPGEP